MWGIFRGISRIGDELLQVHLGDLVEGLPPEELEHWIGFNVDAPSLEEIKETRKVKPLQHLLNELKEMKEHAKDTFLGMCFRCGMDREFLRDNPIYRDGENEDDYLKILKKTLTPRDTNEIFLTRILELNKWLADSLNITVLRACIDHFDPNEKFDASGKPLRSIRLFQKSLIFLFIFRKLAEIKQIPQHELINETKIYYNLIRQRPHEKSNFILDDLNKECETLNQKFEIMLMINEIRSTYVHETNKTKIQAILRKLGFSLDGTNYLDVYRTIIGELRDLFTFIYVSSESFARAYEYR